MKLTYDPRHNIAYLRLQEKTTQVETVRVSESLNVDLAPDGTVYGIELLNANEQLRGRETRQVDRRERGYRNQRRGGSTEKLENVLSFIPRKPRTRNPKLETATAQPQSEQRHLIARRFVLLLATSAFWKNYLLRITFGTKVDSRGSETRLHGF